MIVEENFSFGYWLRRQRLARDLRQADFAQQLGIAPITLRKIEADERRPSLQLITRVADLLALSDVERSILIQVARADLSPSALPLPEDASAIGLVEEPLPSTQVSSTMPLPSGTVTFLFTDIEGSSARWEQHPTAMRGALAQHDVLLRTAVVEHGGVLIKSMGDGILAAFALAEDALMAALTAQRALQRADWGTLGRLPVRMGVHTGAAEPQDGDYLGPTLNRAARIMGTGHGGQILLSRATAELLQDQLPTTITLQPLGSFRLKDLTRPEQILQVVVADLPANFPTLRTLDARQHNLPAQATALIGREREVSELCDLLRQPAVRLVTLTGPGGTGKTRLALQTAAELIEHFPQGVWFVNLAPVTDAALVLPAIAQTLDIREIAGRTWSETLRDALRDQQLLLVLDNFEQIVAAAVEIATLLAAAPQLKILVTSREALHLAAEHVVAVPPLALPERMVRLPIEQFSQYEALRLFIERARAVRADFSITNTNAPVLAEICWRLDGLPLAIELAAARIRLFTPEALLARLEQRLSLLTTGPRDLPARHQTLRTTIDWSYALLTTDEQILFRRVAVFLNGCQIEAIERICDLDATLGTKLLDCLAALVDKSLVKQYSDSSGEPRFSMLETIREYALERLIAFEEEETVRRAHAAYYLDFAEVAELQLTSGRRQDWVLRLEQDNDNLRAALTWSRSATNGDTILLRLAGALWWFWHFCGYAATGRTWLEEALTSEAGQMATEGRAKALCGAGALADHQGDHETARVWLEESIALYRAVGNRRGLGYALTYFGLVVGHQSQPDYHVARISFEESIELLRNIGDHWGLALAIQLLGEIDWYECKYEIAKTLFEESTHLFAELGDHWGHARGLGLVGFVLHDQEHDNQAHLCFEESIAAMRTIGDKFVLAALLTKHGQVLRCLGEYEQAVACYNESIVSFQALGNTQWTSDPLRSLGFVALHQGDVVRAIRYLTESLALDYAGGSQEAMAISLAGFACVAAMQEQYERAARLFGAAIVLIQAGTGHPDRAYLIAWDLNLITVREQLDTPTFDAAWAAGQAMTLDRVIAYAQEHD